MPTPVILDCDPGHDDAFAIWLAAGLPGIDLRAITTVGGNGRLEDTTHNARVVCTVAGITDVPIAAGAAGPLVRTLTPAEHIHGPGALGGPVLPEPTVPLDDRGAVQLIRDTVHASDGPVTLVPTGPLTNIASYLAAYPADRERIAEIVWMGGSTGRGNVTPYAEFNAWVDPEAVDIVLRSGVRFTMVGLNVTHQALVGDAVQRRIAAIGNETATFGTELLTFFRGSYQDAERMPEAPLHDPVTVALVARPELVTTVHTRLDVELHGTETAGATSVDLLDARHREPNAWVATTLDAPGFWDLVEQAVRALR